MTTAERHDAGLTEGAATDALKQTDVRQEAVVDTDTVADAGHRLPFVFAKRFGVLIAEDMDGPHLIYRRDAPLEALAEARRFWGRRLPMERVESGRFDDALQAAYERSSGEAVSLMGDVGGDLDLDHVARELGEPQDLLESEDDAPIIRLINALLTEAIKEGASDIHVEPFEHRLVVRFRVDGVLREVLQPPIGLAPLLTSRIKVMAQLDIAEKRQPQDGRISLRVAGRPVDVRVSTVPSSEGERVVLRLLDKQAGRLDLEHLGMDANVRADVDRLIHEPHGILLVTGPTGSGKTTTLYAALTRLNDKTRNIMTVEDPIEYQLDGIGQTQVSPKVGMTFARGLRAILRQDPDVVMVGEIRDLETVQIAVQASLTGHMVLSTLHTNTAVGAVTRLRDMGVEPFLLSSSLLGVLAQRLVRVLCPDCKQPREATTGECELMGVAGAPGGSAPVMSEDGRYAGAPGGSAPVIHHPVGCERCNGTGFRGRTGIYELFVVDDATREQIHDGAPEHVLVARARQRFPSIREDGVRRVLAGETALEEVLRVTHDA